MNLLLKSIIIKCRGNYDIIRWVDLYSVTSPRMEMRLTGAFDLIATFHNKSEDLPIATFINTHQAPAAKRISIQGKNRQSKLCIVTAKEKPSNHVGPLGKFPLGNLCETGAPQGKFPWAGFYHSTCSWVSERNATLKITRCNVTIVSFYNSSAGCNYAHPCFRGQNRSIKIVHEDNFQQKMTVKQSEVITASICPFPSCRKASRCANTTPAVCLCVEYVWTNSQHEHASTEDVFVERRHPHRREMWHRGWCVENESNYGSILMGPYFSPVGGGKKKLIILCLCNITRSGVKQWGKGGAWLWSPNFHVMNFSLPMVFFPLNALPVYKQPRRAGKRRAPGWPCTPSLRTKLSFSY